MPADPVAAPLEAGSDEELALRRAWLSRLMFGWMLPSDLAHREDRGYEEWLLAQGLVLA